MHQAHMTAAEYQEYIKKPKRRQKYNARRTDYNGVTYDSKKEAHYAQQLDLLIRAGEVMKVERQVEIKIQGGKHFVDFKVFFADGRIEYHEVKGMDHPLGRHKRKQAEEVLGALIKVI